MSQLSVKYNPLFLNNFPSTSKCSEEQCLHVDDVFQGWRLESVTLLTRATRKFNVVESKRPPIISVSRRLKTSRSDLPVSLHIFLLLGSQQQRPLQTTKSLTFNRIYDLHTTHLWYAAFLSSRSNLKHASPIIHFPFIGGLLVLYDFFNIFYRPQTKQPHKQPRYKYGTAVKLAQLFLALRINMLQAPQRKLTP